MMTDRTAQLQNFLTTREHKGYASEATLARALRSTLEAIATDLLDGNLETHRIAAGPHAGRFIAVLVFGPAEQVPTGAIRFAHAGIPLFQYHAGGR